MTDVMHEADFPHTFGYDDDEHAAPVAAWLQAQDADELCSWCDRVSVEGIGTTDSRCVAHDELYGAAIRAGQFRAGRRDGDAS